MFTVDLARLKAAMADAGLDQSGLARAVGCTPGAINQIVQGNVERSRLLPEIARELAVDFDWLTGADVEMRRNQPSKASLRRDEYKLVDNYRACRRRDQDAIARIASALHLQDDVSCGVYPLPPERALTVMFDALLAGIDPKASRGEQALLLARRLPIGLSHLRDLLPDEVTPARALEEALADGPIPDRPHRP